MTGPGDTSSTTDAPPPPPAPSHRPPGERPGDLVGPYKLLELIGEGGFGTVWLAERREPMVQRVALKIIKPGMDSKAVIARFEQERQALAVMDHPNVAKVFDAGTTPAGRPYFVMEHVKGEPITDFCDRHNLTIRQRLELFIPVCEAVQHAHMKGIIHRDLKPSNILVASPNASASPPVPGAQSPVPLPKVIDFGVAKAISHTLTDKTIFTETGQLIGTPEYMSPEQAEMGALDIDTRTDVYSLGVLLYELLAGAVPFDPKTLRAKGYADIQRVIREVDPPRPSTRLTSLGAEAAARIAKQRQSALADLAATLKRELEWIPLMAMRKDRSLRYQTARELAEDVQRYSGGRPLTAGPESATYRLRKFVRRNRAPVLAAGAMVILLVAGLAGTLWQAQRAGERAEAAARAEAEQRRLALAEGEARRLADAKTGEAEDALQTIEYNSYLTNIQMAQAALDSRQFDRLRQRLDACPDHLRGWEWGWLNAESDNSLTLLKGHTDRVNTARFSPDGTRIVTASRDKTARVWNAATGASLAELKGHTHGVISAAFSPDGARVVTASADKTARVWDAATGASLAELKHVDVVTSAAFSPDGGRIATALLNDQTVRVWDAATGARLASLVGGTSAAFSPDGARIVTGSYHGGQVWDAATGASLAELKGHTDHVRSAAFSPDGSRIVTASQDKTARVWDAATGASLAELKGHTALLTTAAFSPDGVRIVTASGDTTARLWDAATGASLAELKDHTNGVISAAFSPDGTRLVTASVDGTARVWDAATGAGLAELKGHTESVTSAAFSPDGTRLVTASGDKNARVWDAATGASPAELKGHTGYVTSAAFNPDGSLVITAGGGSTWVWEAATGARLAELKGVAIAVNSAAFSPNGSRIITASQDHTVRLWDAATAASLAELKGAIASAAFSPDGVRIVTASRDNTARVWDAATGASLAELRGYTKSVNSGAFSPDGSRIVTASENTTARVWDASTGASLAELKGHSNGVSSAAFSPDGARIVTTQQEGTARVWDAATGATLAELKGHAASVTYAAFSPDGARIVTASRDNTARVWDAATGASLAELRGHTKSVNYGVFSPDGSRIVTVSEDTTARVWDAGTGTSLAELKGHTASVSSAAFSPDGTRFVTAAGDSTARVWDSIPYRERFPALQRSRAARARMAPIVRTRVSSGQPLEHVIAALAADRSLAPEDRAAAMAEGSVLRDQAARSQAQAREALLLNAVAWNAVRRSDVTPDKARGAVRDARRACQLAPDDANYTNTLGVALYRSGNFEESLATFLKAEDLYAKLADDRRRGPQPAEWAFIAMCHHKLGRSDDARAALAKLRALMQDPKHHEGETGKENEAFLREATKLIEGSADQKK